MRFVSSSCSFFGRQLARFLTQPAQRHDAFAVSDITTLRATLQPGDVLLVEGNTRISTAIKYLTQSSWSHAAFYIGDALKGDPRWQGDLIEADLVKGVIAVSLENYSGFNTRICRPLGLSEAERGRLVEYMEAQLGHQYDLRNIIDLMRYLLPTPPVPSWMRRRLLAFGSGDPTRGICSTIIAQAFQSLRYPILPRVASDCTDPEQACFEMRHFSHFTPRDFDLSPYFAVIKPALQHGFDFRQLQWANSRSIAPATSR